MTIGYGYWEGIPTRYRPGEAWCFADGAWREVDSTEVFMKAAVVSKETFERMFGELPPLPSAAFQR